MKNPNHQRYYEENKAKLNERRTNAYIKQKWNFVDDEDIKFWRTHRPVIKAIYRNCDVMDKAQLIKLINQIYERNVENGENTEVEENSQ